MCRAGAGDDAGRTRPALSELLAEKVHIAAPRIKSGSANPAPKLATLIAGMCAGADCIDDVDVVRSGGMKTLFGGVYAPSTIGTLLREFTFGHARQLESVLGAHLVALCARVDLLPGADQRAFVDIDSLLRPVYGHAKQGASYGHTKIAGKQILRKGLSPLATTISTAGARPGDRRDAAARRAGPTPARVPGGWSPKPSPPPAPPGPAGRSWCAVIRPTATARWWAPADAPVPSSRWC